MPGGRPSRVSREQIAKAALALVERDGLDALSMRRVADELGVGKMTLYGHVNSKAELLDAVVEAAVEDFALPALLEGSWRDQIRSLATAAYEGLVAHPAVVEIRLRRPVVQPDALRFGEAGMRILEEAGFEPGEAARAFRLLFVYVFGFAGISPAASVDEFRRETAVAIAALDPEEFPQLTSAGSEFAQAMGGRDQFAYGLERLIDGLEHRLSVRPG
jgi:AcrR family transcriptional regulator